MHLIQDLNYNYSLVGDVIVDRRAHRRMTSHSAMPKFSRHASFEQICEVAEQERNRLYFESRSQPSSPTIKRMSHCDKFNFCYYGCITFSILNFENVRA